MTSNFRYTTPEVSYIFPIKSSTVLNKYFYGEIRSITRIDIKKLITL